MMTQDQMALARCSKVNFENFEKAFPGIDKHPFYMVAKAQLNEALGEGPTVEDFAAEVSPHDNVPR